MAYKVFTNGSVLNGSEVNDNLMNQAVITFSNSTARGSALTSPVQGMVTYLEDTDTYEYWDGAAWVSLASNDSGLIHILTRSVSAVSTESFNNVFSSEYDNYLMILTGSNSEAGAASIRFRASGVDNSANEYLRQFHNANDTTITSAKSTATSYSAQSQGTDPDSQIFHFFSPFKAEVTRILSSRILGSVNFSLNTTAGLHNVSSSFDGFSFSLTAGSWTGQFSIYGYRKS